MKNQTKKVLIVDDESDIRDVFADYFFDSGIELQFASSGNEALKTLDKQDFDLILSDVRMPDGDGIYLLETIRKRSKTSPQFLLMTGFSEIDKNAAIKKGAADLLSKPIDFSEIDNILRKYL